MRRLLVLLLLSHAALAQPVPDPVREKERAAPESLTPPRLLEPVIAEYPPGATGGARVVLQVDVDESGLPQNVKVLSQPQPGFDESSLAAAQKLRFEPARRGDKPIAVRIQYAFNFAAPTPSAARGGNCPASRSSPESGRRSPTRKDASRSAGFRKHSRSRS